MRFLVFSLIAAGLSFAADFTTGQAARLVIGQRTFTDQNGTPSAEVLGGAGGVAFANDMLFVADSNRVGANPLNHRVLVYQNLSSMFPGPLDIPDYNRRCPLCGGTAGVVLGQTDFDKTEIALTQTGMRLPTAVASDGVRLAVADTDNNRVLIWLTIPTTNGQPADVVVGQPSFNSNVAPRPPNESSLRGPQGVWLQDGKLYVADTQNHRVLIWNSVPTSNGQPADLVLGQPNFTTFVEVDLTKAEVNARADTLLNPVSVTSDGQRLYIADLGLNRVLMWNSLPTRNQQPADIAIGQPDMTSGVANNVRPLCAPTGQDDQGNDTFPFLCNATLDFPRFALSDGQRLFISDGGNDRVLVFNRIPTQSGEGADAVLGQLRFDFNSNSDSADPLRRSSADSLRTPMGLAWDGTNLYVADPFNRRVMVFTLAEPILPLTAVRNAASFQVFASGAIIFEGNVKENDEVTIKIVDKEYKYKIPSGATFASVINALVEAINEGEGDPNVVATPNEVLNVIILTARVEGNAGDQIEYTTSTSTGAEIVVRTAGFRLSGGQDAAKVAPGTVVTIVGDNFTDQTVAAPDDADPLPTELGGVRVFFDGIPAPLLYVSPGWINAQVPFEILDSTSINAYIRTQWPDRITISNAVAVPIIPQNPGIFTYGGQEPRPGVVQHYSSNATGTVQVEGTVQANDQATITIEDRSYTYTVTAGDTKESIRDGLINLVNQDPRVEAFPASQFTWVRLRAREPGEAGVGIPYSASTNQGAQVILTPVTQALCCANTAGALVTEENPAIPGETIIVFATGLGIILPDEAKEAVRTGEKYKGPPFNNPIETVSSLAGAKTANVLFAGMRPGMVGVYEVHLELNSDIPTNPLTQLTIAQDIYVSNIITFPVFNPAPPEEEQ